MLTDGRFWVGVLMGVLIYWLMQKYGMGFGKPKPQQ